MTLNQLKQSLPILCAALGLPEKDAASVSEQQRRGVADIRCCCPHWGREPGKNSQALAISQDGDKSWVWHCKAGCGGGTFFDAIDKREHFGGDKRKIMAYLQEKLGLKMSGKLRPRDPVLNVSPARKFLDSFPKEAPPEYLKKRGITDTVIKKYGLRFSDHVNFTSMFNGYFKWAEKWTGWILPITIGGTLKGIKAHAEIITQSDQPKCFWFPFGTEKNEKGKLVHKVAALWPEIEPLPAGAATNAAHSEAFLCPGELKALSFQSMGYAATSPTEAESAELYEEWLDYFIPFENLYVPFDNDKTGRDFRDMALAFLERVPALPGKTRRAAAFDFGANNGNRINSQSKIAPQACANVGTENHGISDTQGIKEAPEVPPVEVIDKEDSIVTYKNVTPQELQRLKEMHGD